MKKGLAKGLFSRTGGRDLTIFAKEYIIIYGRTMNFFGAFLSVLEVSVYASTYKRKAA